MAELLADTVLEREHVQVAAGALPPLQAFEGDAYRVDAASTRVAEGHGDAARELAAARRARVAAAGIVTVVAEEGRRHGGCSTKLGRRQPGSVSKSWKSRRLSNRPGASR
jgi:hypothetical protein